MISLLRKLQYSILSEIAGDLKDALIQWLKVAYFWS